MSQYNDSENNSSYQPDLPMRWHGFLIYFSLWAGAVSVVVSAFRLFTGMDYTQGGLSLDYVYGMYPSLRTISMLFGAIFLALSVFMFRFDVTYQAKGEFGLDKDSLVFTIGWVTAMVLAIINLGCVIWRKTATCGTAPAADTPCWRPGSSRSMRVAPLPRSTARPASIFR